MGNKRSYDSVNRRKEIFRVHAEHERGLSDEQVRERLESGWVNTPVDSPTKTVPQIIKSNVFTYFNMIFFIIAFALICVGSFNNLSFLLVVFINLLIGIIQEIKAKKTLDSLSLLNESTIVTVRNGKQVKVRTERLVLDDIIFLGAGNQICADAVVIKGEVQVNEALVTGEADEITKKHGDELLSGSYVVSGSCFARITAVGSDSFVSKLTLGAKNAKKTKTAGMMLSLKRLIMVIGFLIIPLAIALFTRQHITLGLDVPANVTQTAAAIIGMIPEGLYLLVNITLAVSVIKLAKKDTLVHELKCIETLARVDTLCVDKTGTITDNSMLVSEIVPLTRVVDPNKLLADFVYNMQDDNITMHTLKSFYGANEGRTAISVMPFSSTTKMSSVTFSAGEKYTLGAPEYVLGDIYYSYKDVILPYILAGKRVLAFVRSTSESSQLTPLALVTLVNPVRPEAKDTFTYFASQGVNIKVISGDNPYTAAAAAKDAGINGSDKLIDVTGLYGTELEEAAISYNVFGRVKPDQKRDIIRALKKKGHTVAMTGDGVNDILAMKDADCSIAMASGSDVTCQVAHLVLMKSQFSSLPSVVDEGRQVINNIQRSASLYLVKNIFSFLLAICSIIAVFEYPLQPAQISLISLLTIGIPSFVLALEPNHSRIRGKFLLNVIYSALPAALTNLIIVMGVVLFTKEFDISSSMSSSIVAILMSLVGFTMVFKMCRPFNITRSILLIGIMALFVVSLIFLPEFFAVTSLNYRGWLIFSVFALLIPSVIYTLSKAFDKFPDFLSVMIEKLISLLKGINKNFDR